MHLRVYCGSPCRPGIRSHSSSPEELSASQTYSTKVGAEGKELDPHLLVGQVVLPLNYLRKSQSLNLQVPSRIYAPRPARRSRINSELSLLSHVLRNRTIGSFVTFVTTDRPKTQDRQEIFFEKVPGPRDVPFNTATVFATIPMN